MYTTQYEQIRIKNEHVRFNFRNFVFSKQYRVYPIDFTGYNIILEEHKELSEIFYNKFLSQEEQEKWYYMYIKDSVQLVLINDLFIQTNVKY